MAEPLQETERLLTAVDVGEILGRGRNTVLLIPEGELPKVRLGHRTIRYRQSDVDRYISAHLDYGRVADLMDAAAERAAV